MDPKIEDIDDLFIELSDPKFMNNKLILGPSKNNKIDMMTFYTIKSYRNKHDVSNINSFPKLINELKYYKNYYTECVNHDYNELRKAIIYFNSPKAQFYMDKILEKNNEFILKDQKIDHYYDYDYISNLKKLLTTVDFNNSYYVKISSEYIFKEPKSIKKFVDELYNATISFNQCKHSTYNIPISLDKLYDKFIELKEKVKIETEEEHIEKEPKEEKIRKDQEKIKKRDITRNVSTIIKDLLKDYYITGRLFKIEDNNSCDKLLDYIKMINSDDFNLDEIMKNNDHLLDFKDILFLIELSIKSMICNHNDKLLNEIILLSKKHEDLEVYAIKEVGSYLIKNIIKGKIYIVDYICEILIDFILLIKKDKNILDEIIYNKLDNDKLNSKDLLFIMDLSLNNMIKCKHSEALKDEIILFNTEYSIKNFLKNYLNPDNPANPYKDINICEELIKYIILINNDNIKVNDININIINEKSKENFANSFIDKGDIAILIGIISKNIIYNVCNDSKIFLEFNKQFFDKYNDILLLLFFINTIDIDIYQFNVDFNNYYSKENILIITKYLRYFYNNIYDDIFTNEYYKCTLNSTDDLEYKIESQLVELNDILKTKFDISTIKILESDIIILKDNIKKELNINKAKFLESKNWKSYNDKLQKTEESKKIILEKPVENFINDFVKLYSTDKIKIVPIIYKDNYLYYYKNYL